VKVVPARERSARRSPRPSLRGCCGNRQAQAGAAGLGGEVRLEDMARSSGRMPHPCRTPGFRAGGRRPLHPPHGQNPPAIHASMPFKNRFKQHLIQAVGIEPDFRHAGADVDGDRDPSRPRLAFDQFDDVRDQSIQPDGTRKNAHRPRKLQQLADTRLRRSTSWIRMEAVWASGRYRVALPEIGRKSLNGAERVANFMGHPRQATYGDQALVARDFVAQGADLAEILEEQDAAEVPAASSVRRPAPISRGITRPRRARSPPLFPVWPRWVRCRLRSATRAPPAALARPGCR